MCFIAADTVTKAIVVGTHQSSFWGEGYAGNWNPYPAFNLINQKGKSGRDLGDNCARTSANENGTQWFSLEIYVPFGEPDPQDLLYSIHITPRLNCCPEAILDIDTPCRLFNPNCSERLEEMSKNISVTIGPSLAYNSTEPLCRPVFDLVLQENLTEYRCTGGDCIGGLCTGELHHGKYVKIAREGFLNLCEVEIFTVAGNHTHLGGIISYNLITCGIAIRSINSRLLKMDVL